MAGHSHSANIAHRKNAQDSKRAKIFTKFQREIGAAVRAYGDKEEFNPRLRLAIYKAKSMNMPKDKIEAAIKSASLAKTGDDFTNIRYDGYANGGVGIIVESLTDNKNRTAGEVRALFSKYGGNLGETGSLDFIFSCVGVLIYPITLDFDKIFDAGALAGADSIDKLEDCIQVLTSFDAFHSTKEALESQFGDAEHACIEYRPNSPQTLSGDALEKLQKLIDALEDLDDVQNVWPGI